MPSLAPGATLGAFFAFPLPPAAPSEASLGGAAAASAAAASCAPPEVGAPCGSAHQNSPSVIVTSDLGEAAPPSAVGFADVSGCAKSELRRVRLTRACASSASACG